MIPTRQPHPKYQRSEVLGREITELCGYIFAATYQLLVKIREFDEDGLWQLPGVCSCAHWLNWRCGIGMNAAREKIRVARALAALPLVSAAFEKGQISYSKVRAITRVGTPDNEGYLLQIARHGTAHHVESVVRGYRQACRLSDARLAQKQHQRRTVTANWDDDGALVIRGRLPAEVGALFLKALELAVERLPTDTSEITTENFQSRTPITERRADALASMAETYMRNEPAAGSSADRYQVMVHVTAETSADECAATSAADRSHDHPAPRLDFHDSRLEHGPHVTAETSRRLCCDASLSRVVEDAGGEPISIGRKSRVIPAPMRRALRARDKGCRFPGCTHRHLLDGHHIRHWADGGETALNNLALLCRFHHRMVHEEGYICARGADGKLEFQQPDGTVIPANGYIDPASGARRMRRLKKQLEHRKIDHRSCLSLWDGVRMDRDLAVQLLWRKTKGYWGTG